MAHKGKVYPIQQLWRLYGGEATSTNDMPPQQHAFRTNYWVVLGTGYPTTEIHWCEPEPWTPGATEISYRSSAFTVGPRTFEVGTTGKLTAAHKMLWKYSVWVSDIDVIPWGWEDFQNGIPWRIGSTRLVFSPDPPVPEVYPTGITELWGRRWAEF